MILAPAEALADRIADILRDAIAARGQASLVVPGGRTPVVLFRALRAKSLDWSRVVVTLTDERCVSDEGPSSNAVLVRAELLQGAAQHARFLPLWSAASTQAAGLADAWARLQQIPRPFDAVVLGMGEDGHFASLFPGNDQLREALDTEAPPRCVYAAAPTPPRERLSLTLAALAETRNLFLLVTGAEKRRLLEQADGTGGSAPLPNLPVSALLGLKAPVCVVYWSP